MQKINTLPVFKLDLAPMIQACLEIEKSRSLSKRSMDELHHYLSVEHVVPHTLRHAFASHALESESDLLVLKATPGHASMKSTEIYLHPSLRMMLQSMNDHLASDILSELKIKERGVFKIQPSRKAATA